MRHHPGLYVHIPFCLSRCGYCAFVSGIYDANLADTYIEALEKELGRRSDVPADYRASTVFIGGGTPSCLSERQLQRLLAILPMPENNGEATCELNPDSVTPEKLRILKEHGINRCSFGVQTFSERGLRLLERRHTAAIAKQAVRMAVDLGFPSVNVDLISAWPGQHIAELLADVDTALALGVRHVSCYNLILEEESRSHDNLLARMREEGTEELVRDFWDATHTRLTDAGFVHYETSNFALPGFFCQHNVNTWKGEDYIGIGVAAHSHAGGRRYANSDNVQNYVDMVLRGKSAETFSELLKPEEKARECAVFWLRLFAGIELAEFKERTGFDFAALYREVLPDLLRRGILETDASGKRIKVAERYQPVLDSVLVDLV